MNKITLSYEEVFAFFFSPQIKNAEIYTSSQAFVGTAEDHFLIIRCPLVLKGTDLLADGQDPPLGFRRFLVLSHKGSSLKSKHHNSYILLVFHSDR